MTYTEIHIESVPAYVDEVVSTNGVFRGQRKDWPLLPGIFRMSIPEETRKIFGGWRAFSEFLLAQYMNRAYPYLSPQFQNLGMDVDNGDHRLWALAQHYGLPTHLLDWSTDPLVSLLFACADINSDGDDSVVWEMTGVQFLPPNHHLNRGAPSWPAEILQPPQFDSRIASQSGCFSVFNLPEDWSTPLSLVESPDRKPKIRKCTIPSNCRFKIKQQLAAIGYNMQKVMPDLEGVARGVVDDVEINRLYLIGARTH